MNYSQFTPEEQELLKQADEDDKRIIAAFKAGIAFDYDFIRSLNTEDRKNTLQDYNEDVKRLRYYQERVNSFSDYVKTMQSWY